MGDYEIYWLIYRDNLLTYTQRRPERVELIELMRDPFLVSHNLKYIASRINPFRDDHIAGKYEYIPAEIRVIPVIPPTRDIHPAIS